MQSELVDIDKRLHSLLADAGNAPADLADRVAGVYLSNLDGFSGYSSSLPASSSQGVLECMHELQRLSGQLSGMASASLAPLSAEQAVFAALSMIKKHHQRNRQPRQRLLLCGDLLAVAEAAQQARMEVCRISFSQLQDNLDADVAAIILPMADIKQQEPLADFLLKRVRELGVLIFVEGSGQYYIPHHAGMGLHADLMTLDLGHLCDISPAAFALLSGDSLQGYLPSPRVERLDNEFHLQTQMQNPHSIGPLSSTVGNVEAILRCYVQFRLLGLEGIKRQAFKAVVSACYLMQRLFEAGLDSVSDSQLSSGLCRIRLVNSESSYAALEGIRTFLNELGRGQSVINDDDGALLTMSRLHELTKQQLDTLSERLAQQLQPFILRQD